MKKLLPTIGIYLGTFIVLNVGMYFLLKFTQPEPIAQQEELAADSTLTHEESSAPLEDAEFDHAPDQEEPSHEMIDNSHGEEADVQSEQHSDDESELAKQEASSEQDIAHAGGDDPYMDDSQEPSLETSEPEIALSDTPASTAEIAKLAKVLEGMKPAEAAVIAERLPTNTIVELVMRMKSRSGAKMMASLPVPVAASVATRMAELSGTKNPS
jgi:flagellar motility protein MotE (MotC chaperone)